MLRNGTRLTPGRVSPVDGGRGAALSSESGALLLGSEGEGIEALRMRRTGSLSPGDDT